jgi:hypothetical protein
MTDNDMIEYTSWMLADVGRQMLWAAAIYAVPVAAYWILVG